jgi:protocatechuate 3,4-dioxygenase beta subunit
LRATTDADGRFSLRGLAAGRHLVAVAREGFVVPGRLEFSGYPFRLSSGERLANAVLHMIPTGTISGRVFNPDGKPAPRVEVQLLQSLYLMGRPQWSEVNRGGTAKNVRVVTNERGEYRADGVDPGQYRIRFVPHEATIESVLSAASSPAPMLYPEVREVSQAQTVEVQSGREKLLEDVTLKNEKRAWIRVLVVNETGQPLDGFGDWSVAPPGWIGSEYALADKRIVNNFHDIQPDTPGLYDILASWPAPAGRLAGKLRVNYRGRALDLKLPIQRPAGKLTGRVRIQEQGSQRPLAGAEVAIGPDISYLGRSRPDGAFSLTDVYEGQYQLGYIRGIPADSFILSATQGSRNAFLDGVVINGGDESLEILASDGAGVLTGRVRDQSGRPLHNALVALVPDSPLKDRKDYYGAFKDARSDQNGDFEIRGITPGSYQAYAWRDAPAGGFRNDGFMRAYAGKGIPVKLEVGSRTAIELETLAGGAANH